MLTPLAALPSSELLQQRSGIFEILGIKPFGEPVVDWDWQLPRFGLLPLLLPQPRQAHGRAPFSRFSFLFAGNVESLMKPGSGFFDDIR